MSRVISDALQTVVRASQLGDVIVSNRLLTMSSALGSTALFTVILNIDVATVTITLTCTNTHGVQNFNHNETCQITSSTLFRGDGDVTVIVSDGSFPTIEAVPANTLVTTPDQENLLSNVGSFIALDAIPFVDVT